MLGSIVIGGSWIGWQKGTCNKEACCETVWGERYEYDDTIATVLGSDVMVRLKKIDQSGPPRYFTSYIPPFSRYDHSIGVWALLKKAGAPIKEQIVGVLHDVTHTVFSHVGDYIFAKNVNDYVQEAYHDREKLATRHLGKVHAVLREVGLRQEDFDIVTTKYPRLEQSAPDLCADRVQYIIHTAVITSRITKTEARAIAENIRYENGVWFFTDAQLAEKFADIALYFTINFWGAKWNTEMNIHMAHAIRRAIAIKQMTIEDLYETDDVIIRKLENMRDDIVQTNLLQCKNPHKRIKGSRYEKKYFRPKFRGVDPLVKRKDGGLIRLTKISPLYKVSYDTVKEWCAAGYEMDILVA
jgi:HD superfamily phosphohydrolase